MRTRWITFGLVSIVLLGLCLPAASAAVSSALPVGFRDVPPTHWAYPAVTALFQAGVVAGNPSGLYRPDDQIRRSEVVKMALAARRIDTNIACKAIFADVTCGAWYAKQVELAFQMAITDGLGNDRFAPDKPVTRAELFTIVTRAMGKRVATESMSWSQVNETVARFSDRVEIFTWARPVIAQAVLSGITSGYTDGTFRPKAFASRAEAAVLISRVLISPEAMSHVKVGEQLITFSQVFFLVASKYAQGEPGVGDTTYSGIKVRVGTVAVDPRVIPLGSLLYVENYGYAIAADIGGAIKGNRIDLYTESYDEAQDFGMQPVRVWLLP